MTPTHFFCPGCSRHRPLERRGTHKAGNHFFCTDCEARSSAVHRPKRLRIRDGKFLAGVA